MADEQRQQAQKPEPSERQKRRLARLAAVNKQMAIPRVRVVPTSDAKRNALRNPPGRIGFLDEGSVEWPYDTFTKRRERDGDITVEKTAEQVEQTRRERQGYSQPSSEQPT
jgi:hypothetical protein